MASPAVLDTAPDLTRIASRFEPRDQAAAARQTALRLAREARAFPRDDRWLYLHTLRSVARHEGLSGLARLELDRAVRVEIPVIEPAPLGSALGDPSVQPAWRRGLSGFALTGMVAGLAAAVLLPASLSESLPWTSGNDRALVPVGPSLLSAAAGVRTASVPGTPPTAAEVRPRRARAALKPTPGAFSGTGNRDLGTLRVDRSTILRWSAGHSFEIVSQDWRFRAHRPGGTTVLTPGTYRRFAIRSTARWRLKLDPPPNGWHKFRRICRRFLDHPRPRGYGPV